MLRPEQCFPPKAAVATYDQAEEKKKRQTTKHKAMEKGKEGKCAQGDVLSPCGSLAVFSCEAKLAEKMGGICFFFSHKDCSVSIPQVPWAWFSSFFLTNQSDF